MFRFSSTFAMPSLFVRFIKRSLCPTALDSTIMADVSLSLFGVWFMILNFN